MLATSSELQTLAPQLDDLEQVRLLRHRVAGEPFPHSFIHEADAYSAAPADLIRGRDHAPGTDQGKGKGMAWYFCSPANYDASAGGGSARRRRRQVDGGGAGAGAGKTCWHPEKGKQPILGPDKKSVGAYKQTLSYVSKIKTPPGTAKPFRNKRLGWCMKEIGLEQQDDGADQQLVLCKVYRSRHTDPETSTEASPAVAEDVGLTAIRIALLRMIDDLGLHRSIVSGMLLLCFGLSVRTKLCFFCLEVAHHIRHVVMLAQLFCKIQFGPRMSADASTDRSRHPPFQNLKSMQTHATYIFIHR